ncbi:MAG: hypothetical protein H0V81_12195 [Solirubrobacterales bacterium]|nr:hypothetical protein [Solirubrobacterales bacterium]
MSLRRRHRTNEDVAKNTVKTVTFTFEKPGEDAYHRAYHPNMHGTVVVT